MNSFLEVRVPFDTNFDLIIYVRHSCISWFSKIAFFLENYVIEENHTRTDTEIGCLKIWVTVINTRVLQKVLSLGSD